MKLHQQLHNFSALSETDLDAIKKIEYSAIVNQTVFRSAIYDIPKIILETNQVPDIVLSNHKAYDTVPLNDFNAMKRGLELFRVVFSYYASVRRGSIPGFLDYGFCTFENFLDSKMHEKVRSDIKEFPLRINKNHRNLISNFKGSGPHDAIFDTEMFLLVAKAIGFEIDSPHIKEIRDKFIHNTFVQRVHPNSEGHLLDNNGNDLQYDIHSDIFSPAVKYWYFPEEVTTTAGPLLYAPYSCGLDPNILKFWYEESCEIMSGAQIPNWKEPSHSQGSLRIDEKTLNNMGYRLQELCVKANTLVIANVHGFHRRGQMFCDAPRSSIHGSIRTNTPFVIE